MTHQTKSWKVLETVFSHLKFGFWVNLQVLTLDFEWFSSEIHCELETKTVSIPRQFSLTLYDNEGQKTNSRSHQLFKHSSISENASSNSF